MSFGPVRRVYAMRGLRQEKGFTLLEVLVAMAILSFGILGVASLTVGIMRGNLSSKNVTTATVIAQGRLEDIRRGGYGNATATNFPAGPDSVSMGGWSFSRLTTISDDTPAANMKTVTVTVSWNSGAHSVTLDTILAQ